jgi:adenylate kinase
MRKRIVFLGPPGSGKGTQAKMLSAWTNAPAIATGDLLRTEVAARTPLGEEAAQYMNKGALVPDHLVLVMLECRISQPDCEQGFILDGFPRTLTQAQALEGLLIAKGKPLDAVINLEVPDEVVVGRFAGRRVCSQCGHVYHVETHPPRKDGTCDNCDSPLVQRTDDAPETVKYRLEEYQRKTQPLVKFYEEHRLLYRIDGAGEAEQIQQSIRAVVMELDDTKGS